MFDSLKSLSRMQDAIWFRPISWIKFLYFMIRQPFHLTQVRPWPLVGSISAFFLAVGLTIWIHMNNYFMLAGGTIMIIITIIQWWRDIVREATYQGYHTSITLVNLTWGMILFIGSEVCFFFAFFWTFYHRRLNPTLELGRTWPPVGITSLNPYSVPLLNTIVLLSSGASVTWAHNAIHSGKMKDTKKGLLFTILLGTYFTFLQANEYYEATFSISDSVYGRIFFVATGFHGIHVIIGSIFLIISFLRLTSNHFSINHYFGIEAAAWYWHFVDVVWIFLYISIYWWGGI